MRLITRENTVNFKCHLPADYVNSQPAILSARAEEPIPKFHYLTACPRTVCTTTSIRLPLTLLVKACRACLTPSSSFYPSIPDPGSVLLFYWQRNVQQGIYWLAAFYQRLRRLSQALSSPTQR